jgi:hypothetical protein
MFLLLLLLLQKHGECVHVVCNASRNLDFACVLLYELA